MKDIPIPAARVKIVRAYLALTEALQVLAPIDVYYAEDENGIYCETCAAALNVDQTGDAA